MRARVARRDVRLEGIEKSFDGARAWSIASTYRRAGEFFALLGPSGCGKTTTLAHDRRLRGRRTPAASSVGGEDVTDMPVHRRDMGMIFQSYALFPHRTVAENVAFGLRMRGLGKGEIAAARRPGAAPGRARRLRGPPPGAALRRPAAARRAGARDRDPAARAAVRRAARRARPQAAPEHAVRAEAAAAAARRHADLRDA